PPSLPTLHSYISFTLYLAHLALHSFPTRRSSDLGLGSAAYVDSYRSTVGAYDPSVKTNPSDSRYIDARSGTVEINGSIATIMGRDRKSTRLNSSHQIISYAVFCLKKKKK